MSNINLPNCSYKGCNLPIHHPHDNSLCLGHTPLNNKHVSTEDFNQFIRNEKIYKKDYNLDGFIFMDPNIFPSIHFKSYNLDHDVQLTNCQFPVVRQLNGKNYSLVLEKLHFIKSVDLSGSNFSGGLYFHNVNVNNDLNLNNIVLKGDLDFKAFNVSKILASGSSFNGNITFYPNYQIHSIEFNNSTIVGNIIADELNFQDSVLFQEVIFSKRCSFSGCKFNSGVSFSKSRFRSDTYFKNTQFLNDSLFNNVVFDGLAVFEGARFSGDSQFFQSNFNSNAVFENAQFQSNSIWIECKFQKIFLTDVEFKGIADFSKAEFFDEANLTRTKFFDRAIFNEACFLVANDQIEDELTAKYFENTIFNQNAEFHGIKVAGLLRFNRIQLNDKSIFIFKDVNLESSARIEFHFIFFPPFTAYFENIFIRDQNFPSPVIAFRNCNLKDVYFTNNQMQIFSFYKSSYDNSRFISNTWKNKSERMWKFKYKRRNVIFEDDFIDFVTKVSHIDLRRNLFKRYLLIDLNTVEEVANLYRRFKVALDNTKDYEQAGWFYFNEFEMKRSASKKQNRMKYRLYSYYKLFAGYGEKPLWSFLWFLFFLSFFTIINMFSGIKINSNDVVNYDFNFSIEGLKATLTTNFWSDIASAFLFTLYRIIPVGYLPFPKEQYLPIGIDGYFIAFLNTGVLILFITFIAVGLKRIFRRF